PDGPSGEPTGAAGQGRRRHRQLGDPRGPGAGGRAALAPPPHPRRRARGELIGPNGMAVDREAERTLRRSTAPDRIALFGVLWAVASLLHVLAVGERGPIWAHAAVAV